MRLVATEEPTLKEGARADAATIIHVAGDPSGLIPTEGTRFEGILDGVAIETPRYLMDADTATAPDGGLRACACPTNCPSC